MIVVSDSSEAKWAMWNFLKDNGIPIPRSEDFQAVGNYSAHEHKLIGVVGFNGFNGTMCSGHIAGKGNWLTRRMLRFCFEYPFIQLKMEHLMATVAATNARALKFDKHLGFREVLRIPDGYCLGVDSVLLHMDKASCRWIRKERGYESLKVA